MGFAMFDLNVPVTKTSSCILAMTTDEVALNASLHHVSAVVVVYQPVRATLYHRRWHRQFHIMTMIRLCHL